MTMYSQLLEAALDQGPATRAEPSPGEALGKLVGCRSRLAETASSGSGSGWLSVAIADQLAYDVALIGFARSIGIPCDFRHFEHPEAERDRLERALRSRGVDVDSIGDDQP
jgi:hypothetical protein